jgi:16S rRNA (guanine527-N7)-methyltransferase
VTFASPDILAELNVSRETEETLRKFGELVQRWTPTINLVGKASLPDLWERHILDSAQLFQLGSARSGLWLDLGSGGGFPGIVISIIAKGCGRDMAVRLIESDGRKVAFLREAVRSLSLDAEVIHSRIEVALPQKADVVSARALAPLADLLSFAERHIRSTGVALFSKGERYEEELLAAKLDWSFDAEALPSKTQPNAAILMIGNIHRASQN